MPRDPFPVPPEITTATMRLALKSTNNELPDQDTVDIFSQHFNDAMGVIKTPQGKPLSAHSTFGFFKEMRRVILDEARFMPLAQRRRYEKREENAIFFDEFFRVAREKIKVNKVKIIDEQMKALWCVLDAADVNFISFSDVVKFLKRGSDGERAVRRAKRAQERRERTLAARAANALIEWAPTRDYRASLVSKGYELPGAEELVQLATTINEALDQKRKDSKNKNAVQEKTGGPTVFSLFKEMDQDRSGFLSFDEFQWALRQKLWLGKNKVSDDLLMGMWCVLDWDDNNRVFFEDLGKFLGGAMMIAADGTQARKPPDAQFLLDGRAKHVEALAARQANIDRRHEELYSTSAAGNLNVGLGSALLGAGASGSSMALVAKAPAETREQMLARMTAEVRGRPFHDDWRFSLRSFVVPVHTCPPPSHRLNPPSRRSPLYAMFAQVTADMARINESRRALLSRQRAERARAWRDYVEDKWRQKQKEGAARRQTEAWQRYVHTLLPLQPAPAIGVPLSASSMMGGMGGMGGEVPRYLTDEPVNVEHHSFAHGQMQHESRRLLDDVRQMLASPSQMFELTNLSASPGGFGIASANGSSFGVGSSSSSCAAAGDGGQGKRSMRPTTALARPSTQPALRSSRPSAARPSTAALGAGSLRYRTHMPRPASGSLLPAHRPMRRAGSSSRPMSAAQLPYLATLDS